MSRFEYRRYISLLARLSNSATYHTVINSINSITSHMYLPMYLHCSPPIQLTYFWSEVDHWYTSKLCTVTYYQMFKMEYRIVHRFYSTPHSSPISWGNGYKFPPDFSVFPLYKVNRSSNKSKYAFCSMQLCSCAAKQKCTL